MVLRKREGSSTRTVFLSDSKQEYRLLPSALMTRAMAWVIVKDEGGVDVSSAAAKTFRFGLPITHPLAMDLPTLHNQYVLGYGMVLSQFDVGWVLNSGSVELCSWVAVYLCTCGEIPPKGIGS
jgi:hypothetical protein